MALLLKAAKADFRTPNTDFEVVKQALIEYHKDLLRTQELLDREKKRTLETKLLEQSSWLMFYAERRSELYSLVKYFTMKCEERKSILWKHYTEEYKFELSSTDKERYIDSDERYLKLIEMTLEVKEIYDEFDSAVEAFKSQGYALSSLARLKASEFRTNPEL